jgi:hypothetical protein
VETTQEFTVDSHFAGKEPAVRALYEQLMTVLSSFGPVTVEPKKTCLHMVVKSAMAGVYPRKDYVNFEFKTDYAIESPRISKSEQISRSRWHHVMKLTSPQELQEEEVLGWLKDSYTLSK